MSLGYASEKSIHMLLQLCMADKRVYRFLPTVEMTILLFPLKHHVKPNIIIARCCCIIIAAANGIKVVAQAVFLV